MRIHLSASEFTQILADLADAEIEVETSDLTIECKPDAALRLLSALRVEDDDHLFFWDR